MPLRIETVTGDALCPLLPALARLRTEVFRAYPYCYEGDPAYEQDYLGRYVRSLRAAIIVAWDGETPVGASTCLPMVDEIDEIKAPFAARGWGPGRFFYFGESVLLPTYRGQGAGVAFFEHREAHVRAASDCDYACFCSVVRAPDDPRRPAAYVPLDAFWRHRGYTPYPDLQCILCWREVGAAEEATNHLRFWLKSLHGAPLP